MSNYPPRKARAINLIVGILLVVFSVAALISFTASNASGKELTVPIAFLFLLVFMGGYEIGKYAEKRLQKQWAHIKK